MEKNKFKDTQVPRVVINREEIEDRYVPEFDSDAFSISVI